MKKFILATMIVAAAIFTACGDDDPSSTTSGGSGNVTSCDVTTSVNGIAMYHTCMEASSGEEAKRECSALGGEDIEEDGMRLTYSGKLGSGCPSGSKKTCNATKNGIAVSVYIYDAAAASMDCNTIMKGFFAEEE